MASSMCFLRNSIPLIAALLSFLMYTTTFLGSGFLSILIASLVLMILPTVLLTFSKQTPVVVEKLVQNEAISSHQDSPPQMKEVVTQLQPQIETIAPKTQENEEFHIHHHYLVRPKVLYSESSESIDHSSTTEDSDVDWLCSGDVGQSLDCSDDSISDEESLIEIALPSGQFVSPKKEAPNFNLQQKLPNFSPEAIFGQHGLMEVLTEINEEENLIEIDISMGSIKCSRFEIEA